MTPPQTTQSSEAVAQHEGTYVLKDIVVDGVKKYTPEQILRFTGLVKGESVEIPGQRLSTAIKNFGIANIFQRLKYMYRVLKDKILS